MHTYLHHSVFINMLYTYYFIPILGQVPYACDLMIC